MFGFRYIENVLQDPTLDQMRHLAWYQSVAQQFYDLPMVAYVVAETIPPLRESKVTCSILKPQYDFPPQAWHSDEYQVGIVIPLFSKPSMLCVRSISNRETINCVSRRTAE